MKRSSLLYPITTTLLCITLVLLVISFQANHDKRSKPFTTKLQAKSRDLLPAKYLPYVTFGFNNFITNSYWIRAVQDFTVWDGKNPYYLNYFRNISTLDPTFEYPYLFSIVIVPQNKDVDTLDAVAEIANKGMETVKTSWKIPFYLGTQYFLFTKKYEPALSYLKTAGTRVGAPDGVFLVYSSLVAKQAGKVDLNFKPNQELVKVIYSNTDNETIKKMAEKGLQEEFINQMMEKGLIAYKAKYKRYPKSVDEMMAVNLVSFPTELLNAFLIEINQKDGSFRVVVRGE